MKSYTHLYPIRFCDRNSQAVLDSTPSHFDQQVMEYVNWWSGNQWLSHSHLHAWSTICQTIWFLLLQSSCIWRNADNTHNMTDGAALIRNNCEPRLKATCHLCRVNEEVIFLITKLILHHPNAKPQPQSCKDTCDLLFTNHDLLVNIIFSTATIPMKRYIQQIKPYTSFSKSITSIVTHGQMWTYCYRTPYQLHQLRKFHMNVQVSITGSSWSDILHPPTYIFVSFGIFCKSLPPPF